MHSAHGGWRAFSTAAGDFPTHFAIPACACLLVAFGWLAQGHAAEQEPLWSAFFEANDLKPVEMVQVRRLVRPTGKGVWLVFGLRDGLGAKSSASFTPLTVYLKPDSENGGLRRGRVLHLESARGSDPHGTSWRVESTGKYAQVVMPGRRPDAVRGKFDQQRPFLVDGEFDDQTLVSLVELIRKSPDVASLQNGGSAKVKGASPITRARRTSIGVEVTINVDAHTGQFVTLEERNGRLVVVKARFWISSALGRGSSTMKVAHLAAVAWLVLTGRRRGTRCMFQDSTLIRPRPVTHL